MGTDKAKKIMSLCILIGLAYLFGNLVSNQGLDVGGNNGDNEAGLDFFGYYLEENCSESKNNFARSMQVNSQRKVKKFYELLINEPVIDCDPCVDQIEKVYEESLGNYQSLVKLRFIEKADLGEDHLKSNERDTGKDFDPDSNKDSNKETAEASLESDDSLSNPAILLDLWEKFKCSQTQDPLYVLIDQRGYVRKIVFEDNKSLSHLKEIFSRLNTYFEKNL